jgi:hypothetical protein
MHVFQPEEDLHGVRPGRMATINPLVRRLQAARHSVAWQRCAAWPVSPSACVCVLALATWSVNDPSFNHATDARQKPARLPRGSLCRSCHADHRSRRQSRLSRCCFGLPVCSRTANRPTHPARIGAALGGLLAGRCRLQPCSGPESVAAAHWPWWISGRHDGRTAR